MCSPTTACRRAAWHCPPWLMRRSRPLLCSLALRHLTGSKAEESAALTIPHPSVPTALQYMELYNLQEGMEFRFAGRIKREVRRCGPGWHAALYGMRQSLRNRQGQEGLFTHSCHQLHSAHRPPCRSTNAGQKCLSWRWSGVCRTWGPSRPSSCRRCLAT